MLLLPAPSPAPLLSHRLPSAGGENHPQIPANLSVAWCLDGDMQLVSHQRPLIQFVRDAGGSAEPDPSIGRIFQQRFGIGVVAARGPLFFVCPSIRAESGRGGNAG